MSDTKSLVSLGNRTIYYKKPNRQILETFDNQHQESIYLVPFIQERDEFTSLCPKTGQPDHASMEILYVPNVKMVESKSLKLYLFSFRNTGEFHEDVCNRIAKDLFYVMKPKYLRIYGDFAPRGGLSIKPLIEIWEHDQNDLDMLDVQYHIRELVRTFDLKNK